MRVIFLVILSNELLIDGLPLQPLFLHLSYHPHSSLSPQHLLVLTKLRPINQALVNCLHQNHLQMQLGRQLHSLPEVFHEIVPKTYRGDTCEVHPKNLPSLRIQKALPTEPYLLGQ